MGTPRETPRETRVDDEVLEPAYSDLSLGPSGRPVATAILEAMDPGVVTGGTGPGAAPMGAITAGTGPGEANTAAALEVAADSPMRLSTSLSSMERGRTVAREERRRAPSTASAGTTDARLDRLTGLMEAMLVRMDDERRSQGGSHTTRASRASASRRSEPLGPWGGFGIGFSGSPGPAFSQLPPQQPWVPQGWMPVAVPGYELQTLQGATGFPVASTQVQGATGFPAASTQVQGATGFPAASTQVQDAAGFPTSTQVSGAAGFPPSTQVQDAAGFPASTQVQDAAGFPVSTQVSGAAGFPASTQVSGVAGCRVTDVPGPQAARVQTSGIAEIFPVAQGVEGPQVPRGMSSQVGAQEARPTPSFSPWPGHSVHPGAFPAFAEREVRRDDGSQASFHSAASQQGQPQHFFIGEPAPCCPPGLEGPATSVSGGGAIVVEPPEAERPVTPVKPRIVRYPLTPGGSEIRPPDSDPPRTPPPMLRVPSPSPPRAPPLPNFPVEEISAARGVRSSTPPPTVFRPPVPALPFSAKSEEPSWYVQALPKLEEEHARPRSSNLRRLAGYYNSGDRLPHPWCCYLVH